MNGSDPKQVARDLLVEAHPALIGLSHWIHANPELGYQEVLASGWVTEWLTSAGFDVRTGVAGMPTAVVGSYGPGPFHVAVCVEYDALPVVGHACGHNVIAAAGVGAGLALAAVADQLGMKVTVLGTPAEETGGGKVGLVKAGELDGVHAAMMVHPWPQDEAEPVVLAIRSLNVAYTGRAAHAAGFPSLGVNAADALVIAQTAIALLRQQLRSTDRVHGIVTKGGDAPNIIPARTEAHWMVRGTDVGRLDEVTALVRRCFEAGALATGATLEIEEDICYADVRHHPDLARLYQANAEELGRTFSAPGLPLSTDMGNISYAVPTIHPMIGIEAGGAVNHQADFAAACATPSADQAILDGAIAMAWTAIDAAQDESLRGRLMEWQPDPTEVSSVSAAWRMPAVAAVAVATEDAVPVVTEAVVAEEVVADLALVDSDAADLAPENTAELEFAAEEFAAEPATTAEMGAEPGMEATAELAAAVEPEGTVELDATPDLAPDATDELETTAELDVTAEPGLADADADPGLLAAAVAMAAMAAIAEPEPAPDPWSDASFTADAGPTTTADPVVDPWSDVRFTAEPEAVNEPATTVDAVVDPWSDVPYAAQATVVDPSPTADPWSDAPFTADAWAATDTWAAADTASEAELVEAGAAVSTESVEAADVAADPWSDLPFVAATPWMPPVDPRADADAAWAADVAAVESELLAVTGAAGADAVAGTEDAIASVASTTGPVSAGDEADEVLFIGFDEGAADPVADVVLLDPAPNMESVAWPDDLEPATTLEPGSADVEAAAPTASSNDDWYLDTTAEAVTDPALESQGDAPAPAASGPSHDDRDAWERAFTEMLTRSADEGQREPAFAFATESVEAEGFSFIAPDVSGVDSRGDAWSHNGADHANGDLMIR